MLPLQAQLRSLHEQLETKTRESAARESYVRERLRRMGLWKVMMKIGLVVKVSF